MTDIAPKNTAELLAVIDAEWTALMGVVDRLTPAQMTTADAGGWSPKDNLAHLAAWMQYMKGAALEKKPAHEAMGIDAGKYKQLDEDGINAVLFERNRQRSAADVLAGLKSTYADVIQKLKTMPFADLMKPLRANDPNRRLVIESVLGNTADHFHEHRTNIEKSL